MKTAVICFMAFIGSCVGQMALAQDRSIREFDVSQLEQFGRQLFKQDKEAANATDLLLAQSLDLSKEQILGWIVQRLALGDRVRFVRQNGAFIEAAYDITFGDQGIPVLSIPKDRALSQDDLAQFAARRLALESIKDACSENYNIVALRDPENSGWLVWALAATTKPKLMVVGGHYRFSISSDGKTLLRSDALSRGCLDIPIKDDAQAMAVTHLVSATPLEIHVWLSILHRMPLMVGVAGKDFWRVEKGTIKKLENSPTTESR